MCMILNIVTTVIEIKMDISMLGAYLTLKVYLFTPKTDTENRHVYMMK